MRRFIFYHEEQRQGFWFLGSKSRCSISSRRVVLLNNGNDNYSKIEAYTTEDNLNKIISIGTIILDNIEYKRKIIKKAINESLGSFSEVKYEIKKPEDASNMYSQYLEEYVQEEKNTSEKLPDE